MRTIGCLNLRENQETHWKEWHHGFSFLCDFGYSTSSLKQTTHKKMLLVEFMEIGVHSQCNIRHGTSRERCRKSTTKMLRQCIIKRLSMLLFKFSEFTEFICLTHHRRIRSPMIRSFPEPIHPSVSILNVIYQLLTGDWTK